MPTSAILAASSTSSSSSGNFLVSPSPGLMIWTVLAFVVTLLVLRWLAFPRIAAALDRRQKAIEDSIDSAERTRVEADTLLAENPNPSADEIRRALKGNICRCTGYVNIVRSIEAAASAAREGATR